MSTIKSIKALKVDGKYCLEITMENSKKYIVYQSTENGKEVLFEPIRNVYHNDLDTLMDKVVDLEHSYEQFKAQESSSNTKYQSSEDIASQDYLDYCVEMGL